MFAEHPNMASDSAAVNELLQEEITAVDDVAVTGYEEPDPNLESFGAPAGAPPKRKSDANE